VSGDAICDKSSQALERAQRAHPGAQVTTDPAAVAASPEVDAVAVITPVWTHFELAKMRSKTESTFLSRNHSPQPRRKPSS